MTNLQPINLLENIDLGESINPGDEILVRYALRGTQAAIVTNRTKSGFLMARKYQAKSRHYTKPVKIHPGEIIQIIKRG